MNEITETLDHKLDKQIERFYGLLLGMYNRKMNRARDHSYVRIKYMKSFKKILVEKIRENDYWDYFEIMEILTDSYKIGTPINKAIKIVRKAIWTPNDLEIEIVYNHKNTIITNPNPTPRTPTKYHQYLDSEILWLFAKHIAYFKFLSFLHNEIRIDKGELQADVQVEEKNKNEFTTNRQVLFMHFIFVALGVQNIDKSKQRNAIQFLTNKNDSNIYDRIRNPYSYSNQRIREDLRYIRNLFEDLQLSEIVTKINKEINYEE